MLTDIFSDRYSSSTLWETKAHDDQKFLVQGFRIISEQIFPFYNYDGKKSEWAEGHWTSIHDKLSMELGMKELSARGYTYSSNFQGNQITNYRRHTIINVCENFILANKPESLTHDQYMKNRMSFFELVLRERENEIDQLNLDFPREIAKANLDDARLRPQGIRLPGKRVEAVHAANERLNSSFKNSIEEFNERLRRADYKLHYHNGFIQISEDKLTAKQIEEPFWEIIKDQKWENVDIDMKEALDHRDSNGKDPSWYAARALESTIKIISGEKGYTHGKEKGAQNYIDNLGSKKNGEFITKWEKAILETFFRLVRNPFGHGPGSDPMPKLELYQTNWAIETSMSWVTSLIRRM